MCMGCHYIFKVQADFVTSTGAFQEGTTLLLKAFFILFILLNLTNS